MSSQASPRWKRAQCDRWRVPCGSSPATRLLVGASGHDEGRLRRSADVGEASTVQGRPVCAARNSDSPSAPNSPLMAPGSVPTQ
jgi:hypothetical protein